MRNIQIDLSTATRWYNGADAELKALAVQTFPELEKKQLPKTWEELNPRLFPWATMQQAIASDALAKLSHLREVYRGDWTPDWTDYNHKYCINFYDGQIDKNRAMNFSCFLSFQDEETRDLFLENFRGLIEKAQPLMS